VTATSRLGQGSRTPTKRLVVEKSFRDGIHCMIETVNAQRLGRRLPGHVYANVRQPAISTPPGDMIRCRRYGRKARDHHLKAPPLFFGQTKDHAISLFAAVGDVGHTLVVGPTGPANLCFCTDGAAVSSLSQSQVLPSISRSIRAQRSRWRVVDDLVAQSRANPPSSLPSTLASRRCLGTGWARLDRVISGRERIERTDVKRIWSA